jgi:hypothetical protein
MEKSKYPFHWAKENKWKLFGKYLAAQYKLLESLKCTEFLKILAQREIHAPADLKEALSKILINQMLASPFMLVNIQIVLDCIR